MYRSLLVPLDGSVSSEYALPIAVKIARRSGATLRLVYIHIPADSIYIEGLRAVDISARSAYREGAGAYLEGVRARLTSESNDIPITCDILEGPVAGAIANHVTVTSSDLLLLTTRSRSGLARLWLGNMTDALIRWSRVPLLTLPHAAAAPNDQHPQPFRRILIPLDGSAPAEQILEHAIALGALMQAEYTLLHIVEPFKLAGKASLAYRSRPEHATTAQQQMAAHTYLGQVASCLRAKEISVRTRVLLAREPARAIMYYARQQRIELIAMATHGRSRLTRCVGKAAIQILRDSTLPTLLYWPQEFHSSLERACTSSLRQ
jgi:nucleotide-binding universal stress UspA family protein